MMTNIIEGQCFEIVDNMIAVDDVMVSIWCPTYNHSEYIRDALRGFLEQKTTFDFEIVIMDDCSNDGTTDIIRRFIKRYPQKIKAYIACENFYKNPKRTEIINKLKLEALRGKYIATCEGDDCWIDRNKLQIQVDYMERHPECTLTVHGGVRIDYADKSSVRVFELVDEDTDLTFEDVIFYRCRMDTASMMYRSEDIVIDKTFYNRGVGDWTRQLYHIAKGKVHYFDRPMSLYRFRVPNSWSKKRSDSNSFEFIHRFRMIDFIIDYEYYTQGKYTDSIIEYERRCASALLDELKKLNGEEKREVFDLVLKLYPQFVDIVNEFKRYAFFAGKVLGNEDELSPIPEQILEDKKVVVWGIGSGGKIVSDYFNKVGVSVYSFCVADGTDTREFMGKEVKGLDHFMNDDDVVVVVAIYSLPAAELKRILKEHNVIHAYFPFMYDPGKVLQKVLH